MPTVEFAEDQGAKRAIATGRPRSLVDRAATCGALVMLTVTGIAMRVQGMNMLHRVVRSCPVMASVTHGQQADIVRTWTAALNRAHTLYLSRTWCLQRAASLTCLLRLRGVDAVLVIGVQKMPFYAHAWVEVDGSVVNDEPSLQTQYAVISRW